MSLLAQRDSTPARTVFANRAAQITVAAGLGIAVGAGIAVAAADFRPANSRITETFTGLVTKVSSDGRGVCLVEDSNGEQRCGAPYEWTAASSIYGGPVTEGEQVTVLVTRVHGTPADGDKEIFIVIPGTGASLP